MELFRRLRAGGSALRTDLSLRGHPVRSDDHHLEAAMDWLATSQDVTDNGGSAASYNLVLGWEDAYPETSGYIVPTMYSYAAASGDPEMADRATSMAEWLCSVQHTAGSFPAGSGTDGEPNAFNTGQVVFGLVRAFQETGDERYRKAVRAACEWLVDTQTADGCWRRHDYRNAPHSYTTRVAWALLAGAGVVPERADAYRRAARRNLSWAVGLQRPNGWFENSGFEPGQTPYLHTIAYTVRGILECGVTLDDDALVDAARRTADKLVSLQTTDGVLRGAYDSAWSPSWYYCLTGNAQMAIVWLRLSEHTGDDTYVEAAGHTIEFLKRRQVLGGPTCIRGGLAGSYPLFAPYMYLRYPNWSVKFLADALLLGQGEPLSYAEKRELVGSPVGR